MPFTVGAIPTKDSGGSAVTGGLLALDTTGSGPWALVHGLVDGVAGSNRAQVTAANALKVDASGVAVPITDNSGSLTVDNGGTFAVQAAITAASGALASGSVASGAVASGAFASGALAAGSIATGAITDFGTEDAVAAADPKGPMLVAVRRDTLSTSEVSADGDNIALKATNKGKLHVAAELRSGDTPITVGAGASDSSTLRVSVDSGQLAALVTTAQNMSAGGQLTILPTDQAWGVGSTGFTKLEDVASADGDRGIPTMAVRKATPADSSGTDADWEFLQVKDGQLWVASKATDKTLLADRTISGGSQYETVAASQTDQALGATGATGDYLECLVCVVATAATSQVQIKDGSGSAITVLPNAVGAGVGTYTVPIGLISTSGAWKVTTAAGVSVIGTGKFT